MNRATAGGATALVLAVAAALWAAAAWACLPQPTVSIQARSSGPAGSDIVVQGENFPGPVEIRWNAVDGPQLGAAPEAPFQTSVKVPAVDEGLYTVVGVTRAADGSVRSVGRTPFLVDRTGSQAGAGVSGRTGVVQGTSGSWYGVAVVAGVGALLLLLVASMFLVRRQRAGAHRTVSAPDGRGSSSGQMS